MPTGYKIHSINYQNWAYFKIGSVQFLILVKSFTQYGYEKRHVFSQFPIPSSYDIRDS